MHMCLFSTDISLYCISFPLGYLNAWFIWWYDDFAQACGNSSALAMKLPQSCTKPLIYSQQFMYLFTSDFHILHMSAWTKSPLFLNTIFKYYYFLNTFFFFFVQPMKFPPNYQRNYLLNLIIYLFFIYNVFILRAVSGWPWYSEVPSD